MKTVRSAVLILDEVDRFLERKNSECTEFFYTLSRSLTNVVAILLTNRANLEHSLLSQLDARVKDSFRLERIEFGDYDAYELTDILADRCMLGLKKGSYHPGIINMIARISYTRGLRARGIIDLARKAGELAEEKGRDEISEEDVRQASSADDGMDIVRRLPPIQRALLAQILLYSPTSSGLYERYQGLASMCGAGRSFVTFHGYLRELETIGLVAKEKHSLGRGKGVEMKLTVPAEIQAVVERSLQDVGTPHPIVESVTT
jgi:cell division control protein 6